MSQSTEFPELPDPEDVDNVRWAYTADQMRAYAELAIASVKREPLSSDQLLAIWNGVRGTIDGYGPFARAIEQAHGITKENK